MDNIFLKFKKKNRVNRAMVLIIFLLYVNSCTKENTTSTATIFAYSSASATFTPGGIAGSSVAPTYVGSSLGTYSTSTSLPSGISLHPTTGVISWTGSIPAATYTIVVKNSNASTEANYTLIVNPPPTFSYSVASANFTSGSTAASSVAPIFSTGTEGTYSSSTLPLGVSLNANTGVISWTGLVPAGNHSIFVSNSNTTATTTFTLNVLAASVFDANILTNGAMGRIWKLKPAANSIHTGSTSRTSPTDADIWFGNTLGEVTGARSCTFNDTYLFTTNGSILRTNGSASLYAESASLASTINSVNTCVATSTFSSVNQALGSGTFAWTLSGTTGELKLTGTGSYLGLYKTTSNGGGNDDYINGPAPSATYQIHSMSATELVLTKTLGLNKWWFVFIAQ